MLKKYPYYLTSIINKEQISIISSLDLLDSTFFLKNHINEQYKVLSCISGIDTLQSKFRYGIAYDLLSIEMNKRIRLKVLVSELTVVQSLVSIYKSSNWWEKEIWDMYGIIFKGHPDMRRILTDYGFEGHPLRKDFPLHGFIESMYLISTKKVEPVKVTLTQEMRPSNSEANWS